MTVRTNPVLALILLGAIDLPAGTPIKEHADVTSTGTAILWQNPGNMASRDLFYGPGGRDDQPRPPFTFIKEDLKGTNPKFVVRDAAGVKWKVKLGVEARPETAATRFVWAVGYGATEDYIVEDLRVEHMPPRLHRGQDLIKPDGSMHGVRLKREDEKKVGMWLWRKNPFVGTREWNGLRVMMALINNWDLKDTNNSIYSDGDHKNIYIVSDLGASFGTINLNWPHWKAKGDLESYQRSKFIRWVKSTTVDFWLPGRPRFVYLIHPRDYWHHYFEQWFGKGIPRVDVHWIAGLLSQLSKQQIEDAFRAAGYPPDQVNGFAGVVEKRIAALSEL